MTLTTTATKTQNSVGRKEPPALHLRKSGKCPQSSTGHLRFPDKTQDVGPGSDIQHKRDVQRLSVKRTTVSARLVEGIMLK